MKKSILGLMIIIFPDAYTADVTHKLTTWQNWQGDPCHGVEVKNNTNKELDCNVGYILSDFLGHSQHGSGRMLTLHPFGREKAGVCGGVIKSYKVRCQLSESERVKEEEDRRRQQQIMQQQERSRQQQLKAQQERERKQQEALRQQQLRAAQKEEERWQQQMIIEQEKLRLQQAQLRQQRLYVQQQERARQQRFGAQQQERASQQRLEAQQQKEAEREQRMDQALRYKQMGEQMLTQGIQSLFGGGKWQREIQEENYYDDYDDEEEYYYDEEEYQEQRQENLGRKRSQPISFMPSMDEFLPDGEYAAITKVRPIYPEKALSSGVEGYVIVQFTVAKQGTTKDILIVEAKPKELFDKAATQAVSKFKYKPRVVDGQPVDVPGVQNKISFTIAE